MYCTHEYWYKLEAQIYNIIYIALVWNAIISTWVIYDGVTINRSEQLKLTSSTKGTDTVAGVLQHNGEVQDHARA